MRLSLFLPLLLTACPGDDEHTVPDPPLGPLQVFEPDSVAFGVIPVGEEASPVQITIRNPGDEPLDVYSIELDDPELGLSIGSVGQSQRIREGSEGTFIVKFTPSEPGSVSSAVRISSNVTAPDDPAVLPVTAEVAAPRLAAEPESVVVDEPSVEGRFAVVLTNPGQVLLTLSDAQVTGSPAFGLDLDTGRNGVLPWELEPVDPDSGRPSRTVYVTWDPAQAVGGDSGSLVLTSTAWDAPTLTIPLTLP